MKSKKMFDKILGEQKNVIVGYFLVY